MPKILDRSKDIYWFGNSISSVNDALTMFADISGDGLNGGEKAALLKKYNRDSDPKLNGDEQIAALEGMQAQIQSGALNSFWNTRKKEYSAALSNARQDIDNLE